MFFRYNFYTIVWSLGMLFFTLLVRVDVPQHNLLPFLSFAHFVLFIQAFILVFITIVGLSKQQQIAYLKFHALQIGIIFSLVYVLLLEIIFLLLIPNTAFSLWVILMNILGCLAGLLFFYMIHKM